MLPIRPPAASMILRTSSASHLCTRRRLRPVPPRSTLSTPPPLGMSLTQFSPPRINKIATYTPIHPPAIGLPPIPLMRAANSYSIMPPLPLVNHPWFYASKSSTPWSEDDNGPHRFPIWTHCPGGSRPLDIPHESPVYISQCVEHATAPRSKRTFTVTLGLRPGVEAAYPWYPNWGLPLHEPLEIHCDKQRPTLVLIVRTSGSIRPRAHLFGIRFHLETRVGTVFPPLVADGPDPSAVNLLHPFLLGYSGAIDRSSQASNKAFYVVAHGWDGGGVYSSYGGAWCADTGYRDMAPHGNHPQLTVLKGFQDWERAHTAWADHRSVTPIPPIGPCIPSPYICQQFFQERYHYVEDLLDREPFYTPFIPVGRLSELRHPAFADLSSGGDRFYDALSPPIPKRVDVSPSLVHSQWSPLTSQAPAYNPDFHPPAYHTSTSVAMVHTRMFSAPSTTRSASTRTPPGISPASLMRNSPRN